MINSRFRLLAVFFALLVAVGASAEPTNAVSPESAAPVNKPRGQEFGKLGDPAPPLQIQDWLKGQAVKIEPGTNIYVLVFCSLSRANEFALTNLTGLQKAYRDKGVTVIAISDESPDQLRQVIQEKGAEIDFTVACDDLARRTTTTYQRFFRQTLLPRGYIVGTNGTVLWFGHPLRDDMGWAVDQMVAGKYDLKQERKRVIGKLQMEQYLVLARQDDPRAEVAGQFLLTIRTNDATALCDLAFQIVTDPYIEKRDAAVVTAALDRAEQLANTNAVDIAVDRALLLFQTGKQAEGLVKAKQALNLAKSDDEKHEVNATIRAMETRMASNKTNEVSGAQSPQTNSPSKP
ncbi:MAG TPA: redoxin domain-containing protein [Verrucomicrobiae bacterium]